MTGGGVAHLDQSEVIQDLKATVNAQNDKIEELKVMIQDMKW